MVGWALAGPLFHRDRGSQYGSGAFRQLLQTHKLTLRLSARANLYHNAWTESFMGTLKAERPQDGTFSDARDARTEIFAYIEAFTKTRRSHSSLAYKTPFPFKSNLSQNN